MLLKEKLSRKMLSIISISVLPFCITSYVLFINYIDEIERTCSLKSQIRMMQMTPMIPVATIAFRLQYASASLAVIDEALQGDRCMLSSEGALQAVWEDTLKIMPILGKNLTALSPREQVIVNDFNEKLKLIDGNINNNNLEIVIEYINYLAVSFSTMIPLI